VGGVRRGVGTGKRTENYNRLDWGFFRPNLRKQVEGGNTRCYKNEIQKVEEKKEKQAITTHPNWQEEKGGESNDAKMSRHSREKTSREGKSCEGLLISFNK